MKTVFMVQVSERWKLARIPEGFDDVHGATQRFLTVNIDI